jgi:bacteriocin-like protein
MNKHDQDIRELTNEELDAVNGGSVSSVINAIGDGLNHVARGGGETPTITIFGVTIPIPAPK